MDDHLFESVRDYGSYELIPRFQEEYKEYGLVSRCPSYHEILDFCRVLTILSKYAGSYSDSYCPSDFLEDVDF